MPHHYILANLLATNDGRAARASGFGVVSMGDDQKIITWADFKREDGELTFGLLSRVSPTGRYVVSTVKDRSVFVAMPDLMISQLFFPIKGILVVYDRETLSYPRRVDHQG